MTMNKIAAALAVLPLGLVAMAMGYIFNKAIESIARNPEATPRSGRGNHRLPPRRTGGCVKAY